MSIYFCGLPSIRLDTFIRVGPGKHKKIKARLERTLRGALAFSPNVRRMSAMRKRTPFVDGVPSFQMADRPQSTAKNENRSEVSLRGPPGRLPNRQHFRTSATPHLYHRRSCGPWPKTVPDGNIRFS